MPVDHARKKDIRALMAEYAERGEKITYTRAAELVDAPGDLLVYDWGCGECGSDRAAGYGCDCPPVCEECGGDLNSGYGCDCEPY